VAILPRSVTNVLMMNFDCSEKYDKTNRFDSDWGTRQNKVEHSKVKMMMMNFYCFETNRFDYSQKHTGTQNTVKVTLINWEGQAGDQGLINVLFITGIQTQ
jgi:hypothetical protein